MLRTDEIRTLIKRMEAEMVRIGLWSSRPPPPECFASTQPFCYDTMSFENWLQWVFIPRIQALLDQGADLPFRSQITPLAEMMFAEIKDCPTAGLLNLIREFDRLAGG